MSPPFVLVHGAWHAGACWQPLVDELEARGERAVAPDLPCEDPDARLDDYVVAVVDAASGFGDEPVVVVGHSLAGLTIPLVPARRPVAGLVFVAAAVPEPGRPSAEVLAEGALVEGFAEEMAAHVEVGADGGTRWDRQGAVAAFYHDVSESLLDDAVGALRTQHWAPTRQPWPLAALPEVPMRYLACADDRIMAVDEQVRAARARLGVEAEVLPGSHSPMLARPAELADRLLAFAADLTR